MSIEKMSLVQIFGNTRVLDEVLMRFTDIERFHPEQPMQLSGKTKGFAPLSQENPYKPMLAKMNELAATAGLKLDPAAAPQSASAEDARQFLEQFEERFNQLDEYRGQLQKFARENEEALELLERLKNLDANVDDIFSCEYIKVRFGRLPADSYRKLDYYADRLFLFISLTEEAGYHWGFYFTTEEAIAEIDDLFAALYFERIWVPKTIHGTPEAARQDLEHSLAQTRQDLAEVNSQIAGLVQENSKHFLAAYASLVRLNRSFEYRRYVGAYHDMFHITGFVPTADEKEFAAHFAGIEGVTVDFKPHDSDKRFETPILLKNNRLVRPFETFVSMYGMPSYNELDPTAFVAISYTLLFGIMFGDLGQGLVIALLGWGLARFKKMDFGRILVRIGLCSAAFGLVYGSVFGLEEALDPLYHAMGLPGKPVEVMDPLTINNLLIFAVGLGVVLIVASMMMNIALGVKNRDWQKAIFSQNGLAGLVFYGSILAGVVGMLMGYQLFTPLYILGLIVLPILVVFLKEPLGRLASGQAGLLPPGESLADFCIDGFFELFDVVLSFITNTMSFLRVGGFVISHAGMMAVVLTLCEMMNGTSSLVTLVVGNLFVMALEGFIVGIQVLRLEFYELFSHYFEGQGKPFEPIAAAAPRA